MTIRERLQNKFVHEFVYKNKTFYYKLLCIENLKSELEKYKNPNFLIINSYLLQLVSKKGYRIINPFPWKENDELVRSLMLDADNHIPAKELSHSNIFNKGYNLLI